MEIEMKIKNKGSNKDQEDSDQEVVKKEPDSSTIGADSISKHSNQSQNNQNWPNLIEIVEEAEKIEEEEEMEEEEGIEEEENDFVKEFDEELDIVNDLED